MLKQDTKMSVSGDASHVVKLRGLPFSTNARDVLDFLSGVEVLNGADGVHLTEVRPGRPTGECFVELVSEGDVESARKMDKEHMGSRYIEVFVSDRQEMQWAMNHTHMGNGQSHIPVGGGIVKLRGLPFGCSKDEIVHFFNGLAVSSEGVTILSDHAGRSSGEAFVHFVDKESAEKALHKDREKIGHRYIEVFRSSPQEMRVSLEKGGANGNPRGGQRPGPYDRFNRFGGGNFSNGDRMRPLPPRGGHRGPYNDNYNSWSQDNSGGRGGWRAGDSMDGGHCVHMRGLPFKATHNDVAYFFKPLRPININLLFDNNNRPSGEADVEFVCHDDAIRAMRKDKTTMDHRYIELFLNSSSGGGRGSFGGGGGGGYQDKFNRNNFRI